MDAMLETIKRLFDWTADFLLLGVGLRYLLPRMVGSFLERKMSDEPAEFNRWKSIWQHYAQGHPAKDVVACKDVRCSMFTPA